MPIKVREAEFRAVYDEWCKGRLTQAEAAVLLKMSVRTFRRYVARVRTQGPQWWKDQSRHRPSGRRAPDEERADLRALYIERCPGWNIRHFYERYRDEHGGRRSYTWVKDELQTAGLVAKRARNGISRRISGMDMRESTDRVRREGMLIHLIAARHEWVSRRTWDLVLTMDDASNFVYSGFFVEDLGIWSVFKVIRETLEKGIYCCLSLPSALPGQLTASDSTFGGSTRRQLARAMSELGIDLSPTDPGPGARRRRMVGTLRGRLPAELAAEGVAEIDAANGLLPRFWTRTNQSLGRPTEAPSALEPLQLPELLSLVDVLCLKHPAQISEGNRLFCKDREVRCSARGRRQLSTNREYRIHEYEDGSTKVWSKETRSSRLKWTEVDVVSRGDMADTQLGNSRVAQDSRSTPRRTS